MTAITCGSCGQPIQRCHVRGCQDSPTGCLGWVHAGNYGHACSAAAGRATPRIPPRRRTPGNGAR